MRLATLLLAVTMMAVVPEANAATATNTATVDVSITVMPYAEIQMDDATLNVTIAADSTTYGPIYLSGTVKCNHAVTLLASIEPPAGAPEGSWSANMASGVAAVVSEPGVHAINNLVEVEIILTNAPGADYSDTLNILTGGLGESVTPQAGQVVVTVVSAP
ncbi:MAG: hypothetical protein HN350_17110 [Phycisphaerales bacterium]|jgi:hypothetical protein|nr:hypothetical protein [Phycisphaerales bacterium]